MEGGGYLDVCLVGNRGVGDDDGERGVRSSRDGLLNFEWVDVVSSVDGEDLVKKGADQLKNTDRCSSAWKKDGLPFECLPRPDQMVPNHQ